MIVMSWKCKKNPSLQSKSFYNIEYVLIVSAWFSYRTALSMKRTESCLLVCPYLILLSELVKLNLSQFFHRPVHFTNFVVRNSVIF